MNASDFRKLLVTTRKLSKWDSSNKCFGHLEVLDRIKSRSRRQDSIYEFYCLLVLLDDLRIEYDIQLILNPKNKKIFPQKPGKKESFSYFKLIPRKEKVQGFQVCFGTKIYRTDLPISDSFTPDISFQKESAPLNPTELDTIVIYDAKYKGGFKGVLNSEDLRAFMQWVKILEVENASTQEVFFTNFKDLLGNCLITNMKVLTEKEEFCKKYFIKQIGNFSLDLAERIVVG